MVSTGSLLYCKLEALGFVVQSLSPRKKGWVVHDDTCDNAMSGFVGKPKATVMNWHIHDSFFLRATCSK